MAKSRLQITLTAKDKASGKIKKMEKGLSRVGKTTDKVKSKMAKMTGATKLLGAAMVSFGAVQAAKAIRGLFELGLEAERSMVALEAMTGSAAAAEKAIKAVSEAAQGGISDLAAAQNATKLFSMGLASTADEAAKLTKIAITLGATMGKGPQEAFEEFTLLLANQSILRLDTFGISGGQVREQMAGLAKEMPNATRETRFLTAVMAEAEGKMLDLETAGFEAVSSLDRFDANLMNMRVNLAETIKDGLGPFLDQLMIGIDTMDAVNDAFERGLFTQEQYREVLKGLEHGFLTAEEAMSFVASKQAAFEGRMAAANSAIDGWRTAMLRSAEAAGIFADKQGDAAEAVKGTAISLRKLSEAELGRTAIQELNKAFEDGLISEEDYERAIGIIGTTMLDMEPATIDALFALQDINEEFQETGDISTYIGLIQAQADAWSNAEEAMRDYERALEGFGGGFDVQTLSEFGGDEAFIAPPPFVPRGHPDHPPASTSETHIGAGMVLNVNVGEGAEQIDFEEAVENALRSILQ